MRKEVKKINVVLATAAVMVTALTTLQGCSTMKTTNNNEVKNEEKNETNFDNGTGETPDKVDITILMTSDTHGKFYNWSYISDTEESSGSFLQIASAVKEFRNDNTLLFDAGDSIQDNSADLFLNDDVHPMVQAMNYLHYDAWTTGNHDYDYGPDVIESVIADNKAQLLLNNVRDENGVLLGKPYKIFEVDGVKIGVIGMVTPVIAIQEKEIAEYTVTDPVVETRKIIDEIKDEVDVLVALTHMDVDGDMEIENSSVTDLAEACPEFDIILASHGHDEIEGEYINGVLVVENDSHAETLAKIDIFLEKGENGYTVSNRESMLIDIAQYSNDEELAKMLSDEDERAKENARRPIGEFIGEKITPDDEVTGIPNLMLEDSPWVEFVQSVMKHYSGADICVVQVPNPYVRVDEGKILSSDIKKIYKYTNYLSLVQITGKQLKTYIEWTSRYYNQYTDGDLLVSFNPEMRAYKYSFFEGVKFEIDLSKPEGERVVNLRLMDDTAVKDDDVFTLTTSDYFVDNFISAPGIIFEDGDLPIELSENIGSEEDTISNLIIDYIQNVKGGVVTLSKNDNWKIIGTDWDESLHEKAVSELNDKTISIPVDEDGYTNYKSIRVEDLK